MGIIMSHCNTCHKMYDWQPGVDKHTCPDCLQKSKEPAQMPLNVSTMVISESLGPRRLAYKKTCIHCHNEFNPTNNKQVRCKKCSNIPVPDALKIRAKKTIEGTSSAPTPKVLIPKPQTASGKLDTSDPKSYNKSQQIIDILKAAGYQDLIAAAEQLITFLQIHDKS